MLVPTALLFAIALLPLAAAALAAARAQPALAAAADRVVQIALAAIALLALAGLALLAVNGSAAAASQAQTLHIFSLALHGHEHALSLGARADVLGLLMTAFIAAIGLTVHRYARRYLLGDGRAGGFLAALAVVVAAALTQALSPGVLQFALGWVVVSIALQRLLRHEADRPAALLAAQTKFVVSRIGDLAMLVAIIALLRGPGTTDFAELSATAAATSNAVLLAGIAVVIAFACKTALAPFQQWLIGTVEAPTPLSALLHAGVINAGGFLIIRLSGLFAGAPAALDLLLLLGLISALIGPLVMWAQTDLKRSLAWSTVGQMGFMAAQCGMGAFGAAFLHLVGHGCYKAEAFLRSGMLARAVETRPQASAPSLMIAYWLGGFLLAFGVLSAVYHLLGHAPSQLPGGYTLVLVQALALGQVLATPVSGAVGLALRVALLIPGAAMYAGLTIGIEWLLTGSITTAPALAERSVAGAVLAILVPLLLAGLTLFWVLLPTLSAHVLVAGLRVHAGNGFYLPQLSERVLHTCRRMGQRVVPRA